jgi:hypothetical protein
VPYLKAGRSNTGKRENFTENLVSAYARSPHMESMRKRVRRDVFSVAWEFVAQKFLHKHRSNYDQYRRYYCDDRGGKRAKP